jgi:hypothetical protein
LPTREIPLATRIPEDAKLEAYFDEAASVLEMFIADALPADKVKGLLNKKKQILLQRQFLDL